MRITTKASFRSLYPLLGLLFVIAGPVWSQTETTSTEAAVDKKIIDTLQGFVSLRQNLKTDIKVLNKKIKSAQSDAVKQALTQERDKLEADLRATTQSFESIGAGVDLSGLRPEEREKFDFQEELLALLKPAFDEVKDMTAHVRQKSDLKKKISLYEEQTPMIDQALANIKKLLEQVKDKELRKSLKSTSDAWQKQYTFMQSELKGAQLQLDKLVASETSITEASQSYLKSFFQKRGLYLTEALLVVLGIVLISRLSFSAMQRNFSGFRKKHRHFRMRLLELIHRILTFLLVILGPMIVFYLEEDWLLFSLGTLLLLGIAWTLRQALPHYWHQIQIFLNMGSVREGERICLEGLPWLVDQINMFCTLVNPVAEISQRVPIDNLVDLKSRPLTPDEPWFPCKKGDWVILSDGVRGKVIGISQELVQLVERGGAQRTYQTSDFLSNSPRNLATNFRIKEILGISYNLQKESTASIPDTLDEYIRQRAEQEGYGKKLLNLRVEFAQASNSSLDLVIIADFNGEAGDLHNRLRRAIQRWCVDACTENDWDIPFPQMTLSGALAEIPYSGS